MNRSFIKTHIIAYLSLALLFCAGTCWAQSEEELQFLRMFYKDKDLVVSSTRTPKSISQVADNITVITSEEIDAMNAHSVPEVLNTVPGIFISSNQDFVVTSSAISIQGSEDRHVLVLVDEIPWNFLAGGNADTSTIPIGAIDRIEIIKGPASSSWGSSLGGVINIITKKTGKSETPSGTVSASYGKSNSQDYRGEISGKAGSAGYYLYVDKKNSNGLISSRSFDGNNFFSKLDTPVSQMGELSLEIGYNSSKNGFGDFQEYDSYSNSYQRNLYTTGALKLALSKEVNLNLSLFNIRKKLTLDSKSLGIYTEDGPYGTLYVKNIYKEDSTGARGQLVWTQKAHTAVLGLEYDNGNLDQTNITGPIMQSMGYPAEFITTPDAKQWAAYVNDSIAIGKWSITPGVRYDYNSNSGSFVSPSLGTTYTFGHDTILRGSISRGFTTPALSMVSGGGMFLSPNPSLEPEKILSYQAGMESSIFNFLWLKVNLFRHELKDILTFVPYGAGPPTYNSIYINGGKSKRQGFEVETETMPFYNISFSAGFSKTDINPPTAEGSSDMSSINVGLKYNDNKSIHAEISGRYRDWDFNNNSSQADYGDFIWDFNVNKKIMSNNKVTPELFFTAHNIFNGYQYTGITSKNPQRWLEGGIKFHF
jgi:vitamin B12 transporter